MKIRIILQSSGNGESEYLHFTTDFDADVENYIYPGCTIDAEEIVDIFDRKSLEIQMALESGNSWKRQ